MGPAGFREEVLNVELARLLHGYGLIAAPESLFKTSAGKHAPDTVVSFYGLRLFIEGKVDEGPQAERQLLKQARSRLEQGLAHVVLAVLYPQQLRAVPLDRLPEALDRGNLRLQVLSESGSDAGDWISVTGVAQLADHLRRVHQRLTGEDVVAQAAAQVAAAVSDFEAALCGHPAVLERVAQVMEVEEPYAERDTE